MIQTSRLAILAIALLCVASATAQSPEPDRWAKIYAANNLDNEGSLPFHLKIAFQLNDLDGKPSESGTAEVWWTSPHQRRTVIDAPSVRHGVEASTSPSPDASRERYLVNQLLSAALHPIPRYDLKAGDKINAKPTDFGKVTLDCVVVKQYAPNLADSSLPRLCVEPNSDVVRYLSTVQGSESISRNSIGTFRKTDIGLNLQLAYGELTAITGKITTLQSFAGDAAVDETSSPKAVGPESLSSGVLPHGIVAGKIVNRRVPTYPPIAKAQKTSGTVLVHAVITKQGTVRDIFPLARSNPVFVPEAIDAVKQWTYVPFLMNGEPVEVETMITLNFALGGN